MKSNWGIKASLYINYFVFAILLNSVGIVILKSQKVYGVDEVQASILEALQRFTDCNSFFSYRVLLASNWL